MMNRSPGLARTLSCFIALAWLHGAHAEIYQIEASDDLQDAIDELGAGDELWLGGGVYTLSSGLTVDVAATVGQPTIIRSREGESALVELPSASYNLIEVRNSTYVELRGIRFRGGSHGIRLANSDFITIEDCEVFDTADVAISANSGGTYEGLVIRRNHIHGTGGTGEGMYLGCNNDACRVGDSLIEGNYIHHTNGPDVSQGDGIELKEGSYGNIIRDNVIHDTNYPGILTYSVVGNGGPNVIERNVIWNSAGYAIQSAADAIIRNNIILGPVGMQSHQAGSPSNIEFVHNTVVTDDDGISVRDVSGSVLIANNAIYSQSTAIRLISGDTDLVTVAGNVGDGGLSGGNDGYVDGNGAAQDFVNGHYDGSPPIDVFPAQGSALVGAGAATHVTTSDFNGTPREGAADAGAYRFDAGGNPGWTIAAGFKDGVPAAPRPMPPTDFTTEQ